MLYSTLFFVLLLLLFGSSHLTSQALTALFHKVVRSHTWSVRLLAVLFFPGVVIHELAHAIMARMLFVPVGHMEFVPVIDEEHVKLGSVQIGKTDPIRRMLIGIAPVLAGVSILSALLFFFLPNSFVLSGSSIIQSLLLFYAVFVIGNTMFSSRRDLEGSISFVIALSIVALVLFIAGIRLPDGILTFFASSQTQQLFLQGCIFLAVPLGINAFVVVLVRVLFGIR